MSAEAETRETATPETEAKDPLYESARKRAEELQGFYIHLLVYVAVNTGLFVINALTRDGGTWWFYWPLLGWGIGLAIHALVTFAGLFSEDWKERKANQLYERSRHRNG
jgi:hypothetical protein